MTPPRRLNVIYAARVPVCALLSAARAVRHRTIDFDGPQPSFAVLCRVIGTHAEEDISSRPNTDPTFAPKDFLTLFARAGSRFQLAVFTRRMTSSCASIDTGLMASVHRLGNNLLRGSLHARTTNHCRCSCTPCWSADRVVNQVSGRQAWNLHFRAVSPLAFRLKSRTKLH